MFEQLLLTMDKAMDSALQTDTDGHANVLILARLLREKAEEAESLVIAKQQPEVALHLKPLDDKPAISPFIKRSRFGTILHQVTPHLAGWRVGVLAKKVVKKAIAIQHQLPFVEHTDGQLAEESFDVEDRLSKLLKRDLTFKGERTDYASHNIHAFAAKFPPQIPRTFIHELTRPGEVVLDPMSGSGTTLIEAVFAGRYGVGVDLDPLASLVAKVKSTPFDLVRCSEAGQEVLREAKKRLRSADDRKLLRFYSPKAVEFFRYWFREHTINQLFALVRAIRREDDPQIQAFLKVVFSACIITKSGSLTLARDLAHSRPHRDLNRQVKQNALDVFEGRVISAIESLRDISQSLASSCMLRGDTRTLPLAANSVHLIITSPPYAANAIDYMRAHKFSLIWFGYDPKELSTLRGNYIGSERRPNSLKVDSKTGSGIIHKLEKLEKGRAAVVAHYYNEMKLSLLEMLRVLKDDRAAVLVVGSSIIKGIDIKAPTVLAEIAEAVGFRVVSVAKREIVRDARMMPISNKSERTGIEARMHEEGVIGLIKPPQGDANANTRRDNAVHRNRTGKVGENSG
jgi:DNA modification methylase